MSVWKSIKGKAVLDRLIDEELHELAVQEIQNGHKRDGLWAKALVEAGPDETKAKIAYLRLLVQRLKDEWYLTQQTGQADKARTTRPQASAGEKAEAHKVTGDFISATTYNNLLQNTGELRFHYLLQRWYTPHGEIYALDNAIPGSAAGELKKYFARYADLLGPKI